LLPLTPASPVGSRQVLVLAGKLALGYLIIVLPTVESTLRVLQVTAIVRTIILMIVIIVIIIIIIIITSSSS
jgi:hypothetical protein